MLSWWYSEASRLGTHKKKKKKQHTRPRRCPSWQGKKKKKGIKNPATPLPNKSAGICFRLNWSFHPAMWCPLRTRAPLHVCIYPVTQIRQDPIHLGKQLENTGFLRAHRAAESNSPWSRLPNIPERLDIWYQIPVKAYNFQWLLTLEACRWKVGPERSSLWSASPCFPTLLSYLLYTFFAETGKKK